MNLSLPSLVFVSVKILKLNDNQKGLMFVYPDYAITSLLCHFIPTTHSIVAILHIYEGKVVANSIQKQIW